MCAVANSVKLFEWLIRIVSIFACYKFCRWIYVSYVLLVLIFKRSISIFLFYFGEFEFQFFYINPGLAQAPVKIGPFRPFHKPHVLWEITRPAPVPDPVSWKKRNQPRTRSRPGLLEIYDPGPGPGPGGFVDPGRVLSRSVSAGLGKLVLAELGMVSSFNY